MYNIKQAATKAGISVSLLRQWERRYGVVRPARTPSGYRVYDEPAIARVRAMRRLMDDGWAPNAAARHVRDLDDAAVAALLEVSDPARGASAETSGHGMDEDLVDVFVLAAADLDTPRLERVLDEMSAQGSFETVAERYLLPALRRLGDAWASGSLDVAAEHAASHAVSRRLAIAYQACARPIQERDVVLVGLPPGSRHELGALMFSVAACRAGLSVLHLGSDLPTADWIEAASRTHAVAGVVGVVTEADVTPAAEVVHALRETRPDMLIALGGRAAGDVSVSEPSLVLPDVVSAAVDALLASLRGS